MSWIKFDHCTPDKPEVFMMSEILGIDPDAVTGKLVRIWIWADQQTIVGDAVCVTRASLDRLAGVTGFASALIKVGWLIDSNEGFIFSNFDRHNGSTAKTRGLTAKRNSALRNRDAVRDASVTQSASPREEKRREEKNTSTASAVDVASHAKNEFLPPTFEEVEFYAQSIGASLEVAQSFYDYFCENGWTTTRGPMADWRAAFRRWVRNEKERPKPTTKPKGTAENDRLHNSLDALARFAARHSDGGSESTGSPLRIEADI